MKHSRKLIGQLPFKNIIYDCSILLIQVSKYLIFSSEYFILCGLWGKVKLFILQEHFNVKLIRRKQLAAHMIRYVKKKRVVKCLSQNFVCSFLSIHFAFSFVTKIRFFLATLFHLPLILKKKKPKKLQTKFSSMGAGNNEELEHGLS